MRQLRLVLVTRKYWPLVGDSATVMANLATQLHEIGADVTVLTARWERNWPTRLFVREVPVIRLPYPEPRLWGTLRYMAALARWLRRNREDIDAVLVSGLRYDAYAVIGAMRKSSVPVVLRCEEAGLLGDCHWQQKARFGARIRRRCYEASAFIAANELVADELKQAGYSAERIHSIPNGVAVPPPRDGASRAAARVALGETHAILSVEERAPLVVYAGRFTRESTLRQLVESWPKVLSRRPAARLWLIGSGPHARDVWDCIGQWELAEQVIMPGWFDELEEVMQAADIFVQPSRDATDSSALLQAMAAGVPIVAADTPENRTFIAHGEHGLLVAPGDGPATAQAIQQLLDQPALAARFAALARRRVEQEFSLAGMAEAHLELVERLVANIRGNRS